MTVPCHPVNYHVGLLVAVSIWIHYAHRSPLAAALCGTILSAVHAVQCCRADHQLFTLQDVKI